MYISNERGKKKFMWDKPFGITLGDQSLNDLSTLEFLASCSWFRCVGIAQLFGQPLPERVDTVQRHAINEDDLGIRRHHAEDSVDQRCLASAWRSRDVKASWLIVTKFHIGMIEKWHQEIVDGGTFRITSGDFGISVVTGRA